MAASKKAPRKDKARRKRKATRDEVAAAVFDWVNRVRSTLCALADTVEDTRREVQGIGSPLRDFLCHDQLLELEREISNIIMAACVLFPDNPLGVHIDSPLAAVKGGAK